MSDVQVTPQQIFDSMPQALVPEKAGSTKAVIQFDLSGDQGGKWWVKIHDGQAESGIGDAPEAPQLTLMADAMDYVKISLGQLDGTSAFMQGKHMIKGDSVCAHNVDEMFRRPT